jgi:uncharacterized protein YcnI
MIRKSLVAALVFAVAVVALPAVAGAHVEIAPVGTLGSDGTMKATLAVPNECEGGASTTSVELNLPATPPLTTVNVEPMTGYTYATATGAGNAVTKLTITGSVTGSEEKKFALSLGSIPPGTKELKMTALQHCTDGTVIRWIEPTPPGGTEPEHPAPVLEIKTQGATGDSSTSVAVTKKKSSSDSSTGIIIGVIAAVVVLGGGAFLLARRKS